MPHARLSDGRSGAAAEASLRTCKCLTHCATTARPATTSRQRRCGSRRGRVSEGPTGTLAWCRPGDARRPRLASSDVEVTLEQLRYQPHGANWLAWVEPARQDGRLAVALRDTTRVDPAAAEPLDGYVEHALSLAQNARTSGSRPCSTRGVDPSSLESSHGARPARPYNEWLEYEPRHAPRDAPSCAPKRITRRRRRDADLESSPDGAGDDREHDLHEEPTASVGVAGHRQGSRPARDCGRAVGRRAAGGGGRGGSGGVVDMRVSFVRSGREGRDMEDLELQPVRVVEEHCVVPRHVRVFLRLALE